jgi:hypothetical protein
MAAKAESEEVAAQPVEGRELRQAPRAGVDADASVLLVAQGERYDCRVLDLSLTGCRMHASAKFPGRAQARVEVSFKLRGIVLRFSGEIQWSDGRHKVGIRFAEMSSRRQEELGEVLVEVQAQNAAQAAERATEVQATAKPAEQPAITAAPKATIKRERRTELRYEVNTSAMILLVKIGARVSGRILDLSRSGCRIQTDEAFPVGIYTRVETEFYAEGLPFRLGGVVQALHGKQDVGIRFLDTSERKMEQVDRLIVEIQELRASRE